MITVSNIAIEEHGKIKFSLYHHDEGLPDEYEINYDEYSSIGLTIDLLSRLLITQEAHHLGIEISPANGQSADD